VVGDLPSDAWSGATALVGTGAFIDSEVYILNPDTGTWYWRTDPALFAESPMVTDSRYDNSKAVYDDYNPYEMVP
jgi:hypothetical protein